MQSNLIVEEAYTLKPICENVDGVKQWYINGIYAQSEVVNKNRRFYKESVLDNAINEFITEFLDNNRAVGELNHPPRIAVDPDRISHKILSLTKEGKDWHGSSLVLNTPCGKIIQALLEGGIRVGVSTRGFGTLKEEATGIKDVQSDYTLCAIDCVFHPSAPEALVTGIFESADWVPQKTDDDVMFVESIKNEILRTNKKRLEEQQIASFHKFMQHISKL